MWSMAMHAPVIGSHSQTSGGIDMYKAKNAFVYPGSHEEVIILSFMDLVIM
jgi:hypothetical protein